MQGFEAPLNDDEKLIVEKVVQVLFDVDEYYTSPDGISSVTNPSLSSQEVSSTAKI